MYTTTTENKFTRAQFDEQNPVTRKKLYHAYTRPAKKNSQCMKEQRKISCVCQIIHTPPQESSSPPLTVAFHGSYNEIFKVCHFWLPLIS